MFNTKFSASNNSFDSQLNTNESTGGNDGFSPDIEIQQITNGYRIIITDKDGTESFDIFNGIDGKDGSMGATGPQGPQGAPGRDGVPGEDGIGINSIEINDKGELVLYYSNNTEVNLGKIVGADGIDGKDGVSVSSSIINTNGELVITYTDGQIVNLGVVIGAKGDKGDKGDQGEQGIQGIQGIQGVQGETGAKGDKGDDGVGIETIVIENGNLKITLTNDTTLDLGNIKGEKGDTGATGATGAQGAQGLQGEKGDKGDKGDQGDKGDTGENGLTPFINAEDHWQIGEEDTGIKASGSNGTNGDSAYDIAKKNGFEGTEEEWLESLKSETDGKQDIFIINAVTSGETYVVDKTYAEILDAVNANKQIIIWIDSRIVNIPTEIQVEDNGIWFTFWGVGFITFVSISSANVVETQVKYLADGEIIGELGNLKTTDTSSIVAAINELVDDMGDIEVALDSIISIQNALIGGENV